MRDPYYRKILEGLDGPLDPNVFEACAVDLLREVYPGLVPVRGGGDYGMDGAIADGEDEPFPLIVTTAQDVSRNLRKNLSSYVEGAGPRRKAVLATSRQLTPTQRRNLHGKARKRNFALVQIHDQRDFADRFHRNSFWARELLGLERKPAALSAVPRTRGPVRHDVSLIGRQGDLDWLRSTSGDRLILGQPGAGKTFLLLQLVREDDALFLASDDEGEIHKDLVELRPSLVIVDDAHREPERLARLRQLRREIGWDGHFVATAWPGAGDDVASALDIGSSKIRTLELLTLKQIVEVLRDIGIDRPEDDPYLGFLVAQASNKPGLAVTLGSLWIRGELPDVFSGAAVRRSLIPALKQVLGADPTELLACFALGGDGGMGQEIVGDFLGVNLAEMHRQVAQAARGGLLQVSRPGASNDRLIVQPEVLRSALLQEVFFSTGGLQRRELLDRAPDPAEAVEAVVLAALRGASVPAAELRSQVEEHGNSEAWRYLARLDRGHACWVLDHYPGRVVDVARPALSQAPRETIARLIEEGVDAAGELHSTPSHPLRILQEWVQEIPFLFHQPDHFDPAESIKRRRLVVEVATGPAHAPEAAGDTRVTAIRAGLLGLAPDLQLSRPAATGGAVSLHRALLPPSAGQEILGLWCQLFPHVQDLVPALWLSLKRLIDAWITPAASVSEDNLPSMHSVAEQMLRDLATVPYQHPGLRSGLAELAARIGLDLGLELDEEFEVIFPPMLRGFERSEDYLEAMEQERKEAQHLAQRWTKSQPEEAARRLRYLEDQASAYRNQFSDARLAFCRALAEEVEDPGAWVEALLEHRVEPWSLQFLLARTARKRSPGWESTLHECLDSKDYSLLATEAVLRTEGLPQELVDSVLPKVSPQLAETACLQGAVPIPTLEALLQHSSEEVAVAAAVGEWLTDPEGEVRTEVEASWREAILRFGTDSEPDGLPHPGPQFWLKAIFHARPDLALAWLKARIQNPKGYELISEDGVYRAAIQALTSEQRQQVLCTMEPSQLASELVPMLVGESVELFKFLLSRKSLRKYHLEPLSSESLGERWETFAELAVEVAHDPEAVAGRLIWPAYSGWGFGIDRWSDWKKQFEGLLRRAEGRLREVAEHGLEMSERKLTEAANKRRHFERTGQF